MVSEMALITISVLPLLMLWMLEPTELPVRDGQELRVGRWLLLPPIRARFRLTLGLSKLSEDEEDMPKRAQRKAKGGVTASKERHADEKQPKGGEGSAGNGGERVEEFLKGRLSVWQPALSLTELGLDSLDLVSLRNAFQKKFKLNVPMATFTNAQQTLEDLMAKLGAKF